MRPPGRGSMVTVSPGSPDREWLCGHHSDVLTDAPAYSQWDSGIVRVDGRIAPGADDLGGRHAAGRGWTGWSGSTVAWHSKQCVCHSLRRASSGTTRPHGRRVRASRGQPWTRREGWRPQRSFRVLVRSPTTAPPGTARPEGRPDP